MLGTLCFCFLAVLRFSWGTLGLLLGSLGALLEPHGSSWGTLGPLLGGLGALLEPLGSLEVHGPLFSWVALGWSWAILGGSWGALGVSLGVSWGALGVDWVSLEGLLATLVGDLKQQGRCKARKKQIPAVYYDLGAALPGLQGLV